MSDLVQYVTDFLQDAPLLLYSELFLIPFLGTLVLVPWLIIRLPEDYFTSSHRGRMGWQFKHPVLRLLTLVAKNLLGMIVLLMGIAMLVLPGQGLLTILMGALLLDFPGKFRAERWLISRGPVLRAVNWIRVKWHKPPMQL